MSGDLPEDQAVFRFPFSAADAARIEAEIAAASMRRRDEGLWTEDEERAVAGARPIVYVDMAEERTGLSGSLVGLYQNWDVRPSASVSGGRPFVGSLAALGKRILRRLVRFYVQPSFEKQTDFNRASVSAQQRLVGEVETLRRELEALKERIGKGARGASGGGA
jgi:hypothetical protein